MVQIRMLPSEPALSIVGSGRHLVIADVHIGFESRLASAGICLGKESAARKSAKRVLEMMRKSKSDSLVLLGDVKSGTDKITDYEYGATCRNFLTSLEILTSFWFQEIMTEAYQNWFQSTCQYLVSQVL